MTHTTQETTTVLVCEEAPASPPVTMVCRNCGSADCGRDATAYWDEVEQEWTLGGVHDNSYCNACGHDDPGLDEVILEPEPDAAGPALPS